MLPLPLARSAAVVALTLLCGPALAAVPATVSIEGRLTTTTGAPIADGDYALTFRLYTNANAQQALWTEKAGKIAVKGAVFRHALP